MSRRNHSRKHEQLREWFDALNARCFDGKLPAPALHLARMKAQADCTEPSQRFPSGRIRLSVEDAYSPHAAGLLLHEMIHLWLDMWSVDEWQHGTVPYHGPLFTAQCNRIGALMGLPAVEPEESWGWPWIVQVAGEWEPKTVD